MSATTFDASKYLTDLGGKEYLEVKWRLLWLRTEHPDALIETEIAKHEAGLAIFRARVAVPGGGSATGWGSETADDFEDFIEKAETKALGRALAALGYGTQFCEDFDFSAQRRESSESVAGPDRPRRVDAGGKGARRRQPQRRVVDAPVAPASLKVVRDKREEGATSSQIKAIYSIGKDQLPTGEAGVEERCQAVNGCLPAELSKRKASEFIDLLRRPAGQPVADKSKAQTQQRT
jgi:hypothetical protein